MGVPNYTTPTFTLTFTENDLDLTAADRVFVTFKGRTGKITKTGQELEIEEKQIGVRMNQAETAELGPGEVDVQANWTIGNNRFASGIMRVEITRQLLNEVIE